MLLMIDNYDSFTYNLVQYFEELGISVIVYFNDRITSDEIAALNPQYIVISPGPGRPEDAGISLPLIKRFAGKIPILGVCLGHQAIAQAFGARIILAEKAMHGKVSNIYHNEQGIFRSVGNPFIAARYHSLIVDQKTLPPEFEITAWTQNVDVQPYEIMAIRHKTYLLEGVQFHPEAILTNFGHKMLWNFLSLNPITQSCHHFGM